MIADAVQVHLPSLHGAAGPTLPHTPIARLRPGRHPAEPTPPQRAGEGISPDRRTPGPGQGLSVQVAAREPSGAGEAGPEVSRVAGGRGAAGTVVSPSSQAAEQMFGVHRPLVGVRPVWRARPIEQAPLAQGPPSPRAAPASPPPPPLLAEAAPRGSSVFTVTTTAAAPGSSSPSRGSSITTPASGWWGPSHASSTSSDGVASSSHANLQLGLGMWVS